jgi:tRNA (cmo5U34)-methyltransferase
MTRHGQEWQSEEQVALYREQQLPAVPHVAEGDAVLVELLPSRLRRVLDIGCGDGRLIGLVRDAREGVDAVGVDFSPPMLAAARERFAGQAWFVEHNLAQPLPDLGTFDAVVSGFAIHHLPDERKRALYAELFELLEPGGVFLNLEHVASATPALAAEFMEVLGIDTDDPSNQLVPVEPQLEWLREIGFADVDCMWKWRELALLHGRKPT